MPIQDKENQNNNEEKTEDSTAANHNGSMHKLSFLEFAHDDSTLQSFPFLNNGKKVLTLNHYFRLE